jgi:hypothetical protein
MSILIEIALLVFLFIIVMYSMYPLIVYSSHEYIQSAHDTDESITPKQ